VLLTADAYVVEWRYGFRTQSQVVERRGLSGRESIAEVPYEYVAGAVYAMIVSTARHNLIAGATFSLLRTHLRNSPCRTFMSDMKVRAENTLLLSRYCGDLPVGRARYGLSHLADLDRDGAFGVNGGARSAGELDRLPQPTELA
jgi:hypothetical protein